MTKRKEVPASPAVPASYVDRFIAVLWGFVTSSVESASRSLSAMQILADMHKTIAADAFIGEVHALFGNGAVKTKERTTGSVIVALDAKVKEENAKAAAKAAAEGKTVSHTLAIPPGLRAFASKVRKVAENMTMDKMEIVMGRGAEAAYQYATGKTDANGTKVETAKDEKPKADAPKPNLEREVLEWIQADLDRALRMIESGYTSRADTIRAGYVHDAYTKIKAIA